MFVERETPIATSASDEAREFDYGGVTPTHYGNHSDDGKSRVTRLVKERVLPGLRAQSGTDNKGKPPLSLPLRGKPISFRCKSTTSMDSGYYSEPRIHTPQVLADSYPMLKKDKSKPPLARAVLEFAVANHPDDFKDVEVIKRVRDTAMQAYNHQTGQKSDVKDELQFRTRANIEGHAVSDSLALPGLEHLISGWETKVHTKYERGSTKTNRSRSQSNSVSSEEQGEEGEEATTSCSQGTPNTQSQTLDPISSTKACFTSRGASVPVAETIEVIANDQENDILFEVESCVASLVDENESNEDDSVTGTPIRFQDLEQDPSNYTDLEDTLGFVSNAVKSSLLQNLLTYALSESVDASENSSLSSRSSSARSGITVTTSQSSNSSFNFGNVKRNRGTGGSDPGDDDTSDEEDDDDSRPKKKLAIDQEPQRRLKCPFYQREPEKYTKAACRGDGFTEMGKLKDHLKRVHAQPLRCPRCYIYVNSVEERDQHLSQDLVCVKNPKPYDERIQPHVFRQLNFKKAPFANARDMAEKWRMMYRILFPGEPEADIPSPYDRNALSPGMATALSEALEEELTMELAPILAPIMARIKERIPAIVHRCRIKLAKHAATTNEINSTPCTAPLDTQSKPLGEPARLRKKKKTIHLSERAVTSCELKSHSRDTVFNDSAKQLSVASSSTMAFPGKYSTTAPDSTRPPCNGSQTYGIESFHHTTYPEAITPTGAIIDWNAYSPGLLEFSYEYDGILLDNGFGVRAAGFDAQGPALPAFQTESLGYEVADVSFSNTWDSSLEGPDGLVRGKRIPGQGSESMDLVNNRQSYRP